MRYLSKISLRRKSLILLFVSFSITAVAQQWAQISKVVASDRTAYDMLGPVVAISGNYAIVGSSNYADQSVTSPGAAYIFYNDGSSWKQLVKLTAPVPQENSGYGYAVSINGDYAIVGALYEDPDGAPSTSDRGAAYIYRKDEGGTNNWGLVSSILSPTPSDGDQFGVGVSIHGNYAIIGAAKDDFDADGENYVQDAGAAFIFERNTSTDKWIFQKKVAASTRQADASFGYSVAVNGEYAVVGAQFEDATSPTLNDAGAVYIFGKETTDWDFVTKLTPTNRSTNASFGVTLAIEGSLVAIGAPGENSSKGATYIFQKDNLNPGIWNQLKRLAPSVQGIGDNFGCSVSLSGNSLVVGAFSNDTDDQDANSKDGAGAAYVFNKNYLSADSWGLVKKLVASDRANDDNFGTAVAISGYYAIASSIGDAEDASGANSVQYAGSVYIFGNLTALPVVLVSFEATKRENQTVLNWSTSGETNTGYFDVQRSPDGKNWISVGRVNAAGKSDALLQYSHVDQKPGQGQNLYRLKMTDQDGSFAFSQIRNVSFTDAGPTLYPNPVCNRIFFAPSSIDQISSIQITDAIGRVVLSSQKVSDQGLSVENLSAGLYFIHLRKLDESSSSQKIIVVR